MIQIVDAIMGNGKTSAAIQYMNEHSSSPFLYITPFNDETLRIRDACPGLHFWVPSNELSEFEFQKGKHLKALVAEGRNIAMTHSLFMMSDDEVITMITRKKYVVIIDEVIDVFQPLAISDSDIKLVLNSGWLVGQGSGENSDYEYLISSTEEKYSGGRFADLYNLAKSRRLVRLRETETDQKFYFWTLHKELFTLSEQMFVLTYLFDGMPMKAFLDMNQIPYQYIGVGRDSSGVYRFMDQSILPEYVTTLREKIHICDNERLNAIGARRNALSVTWMKNASAKKGDDRLDRLRKNVNTFFRNYCPDHMGNQRLWCTYKCAMDRVGDKGFRSRHLAWNARSTNKYQNCIAMAYCVNVFMHPNAVNYFSAGGASVDVDKYALANMVQWVYRGAIRCGKEIWVYIPSQRMRDLFEQWINSFDFCS